MTERTEGCGTKATLTGQREAGRVDKWKRQKQEQWRTGVGGKLRRQIDETKRRDQEREREGREKRKSQSSYGMWRRLSALICFEGEDFSLCASISSLEPLCFPQSFTQAPQWQNFVLRFHLRLCLVILFQCVCASDCFAQLHWDL